MFLLCFWMNSTCFRQTWCLLNSRFITFTVLCFIYRLPSSPGSQVLECFPACTGREAGSPVVGAWTLKHKRKHATFLKFIFKTRLTLYECWKSRLHVFYSHVQFVHEKKNWVGTLQIKKICLLSLLWSFTHNDWKLMNNKTKCSLMFFKQHWI